MKLPCLGFTITVITLFLFFFLISCQLALHDHCVAVLVHLYCMGIAGISRITLGFHDLYFSISHLSHFFVCPSDHLRFSVIHSLKCNFLLSSFICVSSKKKSVWHTIYHDSWISICGCILVTLHPFELHLLSCSFKRIFCGELVLLLSPCISTFIIFLAFSVHMLSQLYDWYNINYTNRESYIILITLHLEAGAFGFNSIHRGTHKHNINMQLIRKLFCLNSKNCDKFMDVHCMWNHTELIVCMGVVQGGTRLLRTYCVQKPCILYFCKRYLLIISTSLGAVQMFCFQFYLFCFLFVSFLFALCNRCSACGWNFAIKIDCTALRYILRGRKNMLSPWLAWYSDLLHVQSTKCLVYTFLTEKSILKEIDFYIL